MRNRAGHRNLILLIEENRGQVVGDFDVSAGLDIAENDEHGVIVGKAHELRDEAVHPSPMSNVTVAKAVADHPPVTVVGLEGEGGASAPVAIGSPGLGGDGGAEELAGFQQAVEAQQIVEG